MRTRLTISLLAAAAVAALTAQGPQPPVDPQQPTFRSAANHVRVDMYATRDGTVIEDLRPDEVELLEDGVRQTLESFEHIKVQSAGAQETRIEPSSVRDSRDMAADPRARVFVIFLDTYHTQPEGSANIRLPLVRFLDRLLGPDDLVALMTPEIGASDIAFGRKTTVISNIMQDEWWGRRGRTADQQDPKEDLYDACYGQIGSRSAVAREMKARRREKLTLDALEDLVIHLGGVREERKAVLAVTEGWVLFRENRDLTTPVDDRDIAPPPFLVPPRPAPADRTVVSQTMQIECESDRHALAMVNHDRRLREVTEYANRANVTFYPVYPRGLVVFDAPIGPDPPPSLQQDAANLRTRHDNMRALAVDTDGVAIINTNNVSGALQRILDDLSSYYLLGYYSTNTRLDGRFRNIRVRVIRPGVQVRARRGYRGPTAEMLLASADAERAGGSAHVMASALAGVAGVNPRAQFRLRTSSWAASPALEESGTFWIVGELDYRTRRELMWTAGAKAEVTVLAADGRQVASTILDVAAAEGSFSVRVPDSGGVPPGEYAVRVQVRPAADRSTSLSDIARVRVPAAASLLGEAVLWRRGPSTGPQYLQTADPRYQRNERLRLELATTSTGPATARMLDRAGNPLQVPVQVSQRPDASGEFHWVVADVNLAPLAVGDYGIEVIQEDAAELTAFRVVP